MPTGRSEQAAFAAKSFFPGPIAKAAIGNPPESLRSRDLSHPFNRLPTAMRPPHPLLPDFFTAIATGSTENQPVTSI
jgi:hypothetical protein